MARTFIALLGLFLAFDPACFTLFHWLYNIIGLGVNRIEGSVNIFMDPVQYKIY